MLGPFGGHYFDEEHISWVIYKTYIIPAKPLHNHAIVSVHFNNFYCMEICDKVSRNLAMLTYIYLKVDEC